MFLAVTAAVAYGTFVVSTKRLHDLGRSGAWTLLFFIPGVALLGFVALGVWSGTGKPNQYGPPVLEEPPES